jgi:predicted phage-related endonuclease
MNLLELKQGTPEWLKARIGNVTGSRVRDVLSVLKSGKGSTQKRKDYMVDLLTERLTGRAIEHYVTPAMEWGITTEPHARAAYEAITGNDVDLVGIYAHPTIECFTDSPDGIVGEDGVVEFKCPTTSTHIDWIIEDVLPAEYEPQLLSHLACSGRAWVDFMSFDPRLPPRDQYFLKRLERKDCTDKIAAMEAGVIQFLAELQEMMGKLEAR